MSYINDSKATNLDAVEKALRAQTKPVVLIAGGKDKGFTFDPLRALVKEKVRSTILIGEMAESIAHSWDGAVNTEIAGSLADAVERAHAIAKPGEVVLFSPGTSSFDMFKSYADRGDQFRALVQALPQIKMKIPKFSVAKNFGRQPPRAASLRASAEMGYDDMSEPNMKLSRALADRFGSPCRRGVRDYRLQRDQDATGLRGAERVRQPDEQLGSRRSIDNGSGKTRRSERGSEAVPRAGKINRKGRTQELITPKRASTRRRPSIPEKFTWLSKAIIQ